MIYLIDISYKDNMVNIKDCIPGDTYYVDLYNGDNANDGKSEKSAWKDFVHINKMRFGANDKILLKRNCVWNQTLCIEGRGEPDKYLEVGSYGFGSRPHIRLNGDISERCIQIKNPSYFLIKGIEVSNAGAGIVIFYENSYENQSVYLEDIVAHELFGIYRGSGEYSSNPQWHSYRTDKADRVGFSFGIGITGIEDSQNNQTRVLTDLRVTNCEIYKSGSGIALDWYDHKCVDGTMAGPNKFGDVLFEKLYLHDNDVPDVSLTSMFLQCCTGAVVKDCIIKNGCLTALAGTAPIHLQLTRDVVIKDTIISDTPYNQCPDNGGIDFETDNERTLIERCHFENIPGAAIMLLGNRDAMLYHKDSTELEIRYSKFIRNGWGQKYVQQGQITVENFSEGNFPQGIIHHNSYISAIGIIDGIEIPFFEGVGNKDGIELESNLELE